MCPGPFVWNHAWNSSKIAGMSLTARYVNARDGADEKSILPIFLRLPEGRGIPPVRPAKSRTPTTPISFGTPLADVTTAFRQRAKELHPDARNGDRSSEPELRRILEAYQFLKEYLSLSNTEPPISRGAEYRPTE